MRVLEYFPDDKESCAHSDHVLLLFQFLLVMFLDRSDDVHMARSHLVQNVLKLLNLFNIHSTAKSMFIEVIFSTALVQLIITS